MNKIDIEIEKYNASCNTLVRMFEKKHGYEFSYWVSDIPGTIACFIEQYFFNMDHIIEDLKHRYKKEEIFRWQDYQIDMDFAEESSVNLTNYIKGMR